MILFPLPLQGEKKRIKEDMGRRGEGEEEEDGRGGVEEEKMQLIFTEQTSRVGFSSYGSLALFFTVSTSLVPLSPGGQCALGLQQGREVIG